MQLAPNILDTLPPMAALAVQCGGIIRRGSINNHDRENQVLAAADAGDPNLVAHDMLVSVRPVVGMGVTEIGWTDREPWEVVAVSPDGLSCDIRPMQAVSDPDWKPDFVPGGFVGHTFNDRERKWILSSMPGASTKRIRLCKKGWSLHKQPYMMGRAIKFYDSNF